MKKQVIEVGVVTWVAGRALGDQERERRSGTTVPSA